MRMGTSGPIDAMVVSVSFSSSEEDVCIMHERADGGAAG